MEMRRIAEVRLSVAALFAASAIVGCSPEQRVGAPFNQTGELIALSGGDAGAEAACHTCHGLEGAGDGNQVPRIAGLDRGYLARQLGFFADGQRQHEHMSRIAKRLSTSERLMVAGWYENMPVSIARFEEDRPDTSSGQQIYLQGDEKRGLEACASCHGEHGLGEGLGNPPLAGQPAPYLATQLRKWRNGRRYGDPLGDMHRIANKLTEEEVIAVAAYAASLAPPLADNREHVARSR